MIPTDTTIAFLGAGNMARSIAGGLITEGFAAHRIAMADPNAAQRDAVLALWPQIITTEDNLDAAGSADVVILAVKPQVARQVAEGIGDALRPGHSLLISIAAGIRHGDLVRWTGGRADVVRCMPNTPALVRSGATALFAPEETPGPQRELAETVMRSVGLTLWLDREPLMDAVTALSGSGPAYFFLVMEAMQQAAEELGLEREAARLLTLETAFGAAKLALESTDEVQLLRERVTSPGGTTERALRVLEDGGLRPLFAQALRAAAERARELADQLGGD
jgi:pyrroline-5-carboxylate reductase